MTTEPLVCGELGAIFMRATHPSADEAIASALATVWNYLPECHDGINVKLVYAWRDGDGWGESDEEWWWWSDEATAVGEAKNEPIECWEVTLGPEAPEW